MSEEDGFMLLQPPRYGAPTHAARRNWDQGVLCSKVDTTYWMIMGAWDPEKVTCSRCRRHLEREAALLKRLAP